MLTCVKVLSENNYIRKTTHMFENVVPNPLRDYFIFYNFLIELFSVVLLIYRIIHF